MSRDTIGYGVAKSVSIEQYRLRAYDERYAALYYSALRSKESIISLPDAGDPVVPLAVLDAP